MKTLLELNSKWYWRFIKVIWFLFYILIFIWSSIVISYYFSHYNPDKLENAKNIIITNAKITEQLEKIQKELPWKDLKLADLKKIIKSEYLNNINSIAINYVMIKNLWKNLNQIQVCWIDRSLWCSWDPVWTYIIDSINDEKNNFIITIANDTYFEAKNTFDEYYNIENKAISWINDLINKESNRSWSSFYDFDNKYWTNINNIIGEEYEYRSLLDYIKIISSILWVLLWIFVFNFILLRVIYYIVLWQFFPKKYE